MKESIARFAALAWLCLLASSCDMLLIDKDMVASAKDTSGLTVGSGARSVTVSWTPDPTASGYTLRYTVNGTEPSATNGISLENAVPPVSLSGLATGSLHCFKLEANYANGEVKTLGPVSSIPLAAGTLRPLVAQEGSYLRVEWPVIEGAAKFKVHRSEGGSDAYSLRAELSGNSFLDTSTRPDTIYSYRIQPAESCEVLSLPGSGRTSAQASGKDIIGTIDLAAINASWYANSVAVSSSGRYAYVATMKREIAILELSDSGPSYVSALSLPAGATCSRVLIQGGYLFAAGYSTIYLYDISSLPSPDASPLGSCAVGEVSFMAADDDYVFVSSMYAKKFSVIRYSASGLTLRGSIATPGQVRDLAVYGTQAYLASVNGAGVDIISFANPDSLVRSSFFAGGAIGSDPVSQVATLDVAYPYVYADVSANNQHYIVAIDVSDPASPTQKASFLTAGCTRKLRVSGPYIVTTEQPTGLRVFAVPTPESAWAMKTVILKGNSDPVDFCMLGSKAVMTGNYLRSVVAYVNTGVGGAKPAFSLTGSTYGAHVALDGDSCYAVEGVAAESYRLTEYDISDMKSISLKREIPIPFTCVASAVSGDYAYLGQFYSQNGRIVVLDLKTGTLTPTSVLDNMIKDIMIRGSYVFVAEGNAGIDVLDVSVPTAPTVAARISTPGVAEKLAFSGNFLYVADGIAGLAIYDITNPAAPSVVNVVGGMVEAHDVAISGSYAYVPDENNLRIVNISDPSTAYVKTTVPLLETVSGYSKGAYRVAVSGKRALVALQGGGTKVLDISLPEKPYVLGAVAGTMYEQNLVASGSYVLTGSYTTGGSASRSRLLAMEVY
ncbi:MAG TPA: hypothetical protein PLB91_10365 [Spirochaetales bacterium]|nr:hypothetical protein [Spirochaetales bacterium]HRY55385.1 hypothetical protein [Spirochaetia bacterium]